MGVNEKINVWVVEDDAQYRAALVRVLDAQQSLRCAKSFSNAEEAIACFDTDDAPQVILMDIVLPGLTGIEAIRRIRPVSPSTAVLILTNYEENDKIFNAILAGASGYLLKTSPPDEILRSIHEALHGGAPLNGQIAKRVLDRFTELSIPKGSYGLTDREKKILKLMADGRIKKEIAEELMVSYHTVDTYTRNIYEKLQVHNQSSAVAIAVKNHLL